MLLRRQIEDEAVMGNDADVASMADNSCPPDSVSVKRVNRLQVSCLLTSLMDVRRCICMFIDLPSHVLQHLIQDFRWST